MSGSYRSERLDVIAASEKAHFWHAPRRYLLLAVLRRYSVSVPGPILDVGCGTGTLVNTLVDEGFDAYGVDPWAEERGLPRDRFTVAELDTLPFTTARFSAACLFDVLEHVEEATSLAEIRRVLRPGGWLFVSVPAYMCLWGPRDEAAGHRRRYSRKSLSRALEGNGFDVVGLFGFQALLLPAFAAARAWGRWLGDETALEHEDRPGRIANGILRLINEMEVRLPWALRPRVGSSLIGICRRREPVQAS